MTPLENCFLALKQLSNFRCACTVWANFFTGPMHKRIACVHLAPGNCATATGEAHLQNGWNSFISKWAPTLFKL